jgi:hypothetical protein
VAELFLALFGLAWGVFFLATDLSIACGLYEQVRSLTFAATEGRILESRVREEYDDGPIYTVEVKYEYDVAGRAYLGDRLRSFQISGSRRSAHDTVDALPTGRVITVFYDPTHPHDAVLSRGLQMGDLFLPLCLVPFNLILLWLWPLFSMTVSTPQPADLPWLTRVIVTPTGHILRFPGVLPKFTALCASGVAAFGLSVLLAFGFDLHGPAWPSAAAWVAVFSVGFLTHTWAQRKLDSGEFDLLLDDAAGTVSVPGSTDPERPRASLHLTDLVATAVEARTTCDNCDEPPKYATQFITRDGRHHEIFEWLTEADARCLAAWLAARLGLAAPDCAPQSASPVARS